MINTEDDNLTEGRIGGKDLKALKSSISSKSARGCSSKQLASTYVSKRQQQQQDWDAWIKPQVIYEDEITEVVRVTTDQQHGLDYMEQIIVMRENDKPDSFSEVDFKYLNKNDIEDLYYLCLNKKVNFYENKLTNSLKTFISICVIWERVHDYQLRIESYQIRVNLTAPTLSFPDIEARDPCSIVDKPNTSLIYLYSKEEKRVMYLAEIVKFCDATLERVLKKVKLKIFKSEP
ncbi:hypothetical protein Tco_0869151 [Tanacetum coccineum]